MQMLELVAKCLVSAELMMELWVEGHQAAGTWRSAGSVIGPNLAKIHHDQFLDWSDVKVQVGRSHVDFVIMHSLQARI